MSFFSELKRRNVFRVGAAYSAFAWLVLQVTATLAPALRMPDWVTTVTAFLLIIGLPVALVFAWAFELTPDGLQPDTGERPAQIRSAGRKLDYLIIGALVLALGYFSYDKLLLDPQRDAALVESTRRALEKQAAESKHAEKSIAVLPFLNMSADPEQEYFVDGLAEELLNLLASIPELRVTARTSSFAFRDKQVDIRTIAETLDVQHILEGSVRKAGDTLRVTAQLIEAESGYHLWSRRFDRKLEDVFAIQDEIAAAVVDALKISLLDDLPKTKEINPDAYALYLQGVYFGDRFTKEGVEKAINAFQAALELEPDYAPAWAALAEAYMTEATQMYRDVQEGTALARDAIDRAIALDDEYAQGHAIMVWIKMALEWDWQGANESMQRAMALDPGGVYTLGTASALAATFGRVDEAIEIDRRVIKLSPLDLSLHRNHGINLTAAGRLDEAATAFRHVLELNPQSSYIHFLLGVTFLLQNQPQSALAEMKLETDPIMQDHGIVLALSALERNAEAEQALAAFIDEYKESAAYLIAQAFAFRGDSDQAFMWLDTAYEQRDSFISEIILAPLMASLRSDPRWPKLLDKIGLPY